MENRLTMPYVATIAGSPAERSRSTHLLDVVETLLGALGQPVRRIRVRDLPPDALLRGDVSDARIGAALDLVARAQAVVIATPIYKVSYSGLLKAFLDLLPQSGLSGKAVLPLATGGSTAHLLALDYALRPVLASLGARHVLTNVFAADDDVPWLGDTYTLTGDIATRVGEAVEQLGHVLAERAELQRYRTHSPMTGTPYLPELSPNARIERGNAPAYRFR